MRNFLKDLFDYDHSIGALRWKVTRCNRVLQGSMAGSKGENGYICIRIGGKTYRAHRLIWIMFNGDIPEGMQIDHINGIRDDNRLENLRRVTQNINMQNQRRAMSSNKSTGLLGVNKRPSGKFRATIFLNGKHHHIGYFFTSEDAHQAYLSVKREFHSGCTI